MAKQVPRFLRCLFIQRTIPYEVATEIQDYLVAKQLTYKASLSSCSAPSSLPPEPYIFAFGTSPTYTFGRRERISSLSKSTIDSLIAPMPGIVRKRPIASKPHHARLFETKRGGQTTFHGPGQLLIWPVINIKDDWPACGPLNVRDYVRLLEECTILTLRNFGCESVRTRHPGVWEVKGDNKIAALGVHLRRNISSYGVACNLNTDLRFYERIVACGLEGKGTTTVRKLIGKSLHPADFAKVWAHYLATLLYGPSRDLNSSTSKTIPRVMKGSLKMIGLGPEVLRRLWYLNVPREVIKAVQKQKKIQLKDDYSTSNEVHSNFSDESNFSNSNEASDTTQIGSDISEANTRIQELLAILDEKEDRISNVSFRKCAGISYWSPPIARESSSSVVRRVGIR